MARETMSSRNEPLGRGFSGEVLLPGHAGYDDARAVWNGMIDRRPAAVVRCADTTDVARAIAVARERRLPIAVRGGGHNIAGSAIVDDGIVIDMAGRSGVTVDVHAHRVVVEPGATLAQVDLATQAHGMALPLGINSTTGIAGLTLGGGFGWLTRLYGMTIDNLISADIVTADGVERHADAGENADLFWAIRGGGGNFGVVTRFEFELHRVGPQVTAGLLVFPFAQAAQVLGHYQRYIDSAPEELSVWVVLRQAPPLPFLPADIHGREVLVLAIFHPGDPAAAMAAVEDVRRFGEVLGEHVGSVPYTVWQQAFDPLLTKGARNYWKSLNFTALGDGVFACMLEYAGQLPSSQCEIFVGLVAGAANRVRADATAYAHRDARYIMNVHARWDGAGEDARCIDWARRFFRAATPFASAGGYVNFMTEEEADRVAAAYGGNYRRLVEIKRRYDPANLFKLNQNIRP